MQDFEVLSLVQYHQHPHYPLFLRRHWYTLSNISNYYIGLSVLMLSIGAKYHFPGLLSFFHGISARFILVVPPDTCPSFPCLLYALQDWSLWISYMGSFVLQLRLENKEHQQKHQKWAECKVSPGYVPWQFSLSVGNFANPPAHHLGLTMFSLDCS